MKAETYDCIKTAIIGGKVMNNPELIKVLSTALAVIQKQDEALCDMGKGLNLSNLPGYEGYDFSNYLIGFISRIKEGNPCA